MTQHDVCVRLCTCGPGGTGSVQLALGGFAVSREHELTGTFGAWVGCSMPSCLKSYALQVGHRVNSDLGIAKSRAQNWRCCCAAEFTRADLTGASICRLHSWFLAPLSMVRVLRVVPRRANYMLRVESRRAEYVLHTGAGAGAGAGADVKSAAPKH